MTSSSAIMSFPRFLMGVKNAYKVRVGAPGPSSLLKPWVLVPLLGFQLALVFALGLKPFSFVMVSSLFTSAAFLVSTEDFESMAKKLVESGVEASAGASLPGRSGIKHEFAFSVLEPSGKPKLVVDTALSVNEVDETKVLAFYVKAFDVGPEKSVLAVSPRLNEKARVLAKEYRIIVLENEAPRKLVHMVAETVEDILNEPWRV